MLGVWYYDRQARQLCDEAPSAYKDIQAVMRAQRELTRIDRKLQPLPSYKGVDSHVTVNSRAAIRLRGCSPRSLRRFGCRFMARD
jgi:hypothetical protein